MARGLYRLPTTTGRFPLQTRVKLARTCWSVRHSAPPSSNVSVIEVAGLLFDRTLRRAPVMDCSCFIPRGMDPLSVQILRSYFLYTCTVYAGNICTVKTGLQKSFG